MVPLQKLQCRFQGVNMVIITRRNYGSSAEAVNKILDINNDHRLVTIHSIISVI